MTHRVVIPEHIARALVEEELAKRHVAQRVTGLVRLPRMTPKPEPPAEFWTQESNTMGVPLRSAKAAAVAALRQFAKDRRFGVTPNK